MVDPNRLWRGTLNEIAPGVWYLPIVMANVYFLGEKNGPWVLVDTGVRGGAWRIKQAAMETFGQGSGMHRSHPRPFRSRWRPAATRARVECAGVRACPGDSVPERIG